MRKIYSLFTFLLLFQSAHSQLVISGVMDGPLPGGLPKVIELYAFEAIPDLSLYAVGAANNGGGSDGEEMFPTGSLAKGQHYYITNNQSAFQSWFGFVADLVDGDAAINGDDAIELFKNGQVIDVFGDINTDGSGEPWDYLDGWAYRVDQTGPDGSTFVLGNWFFSGINALDGETTNATAATPFPFSTFILPVEFTFFEANKRAETTQLLWQTAKEVNNSHFEVQRADQNMRFSTIGKVEGFGNSERLIDYDFIDKEPMIGANYYRLKQVDLDGNYDFSEVVSVSFANTDEIRVFPTVARTNFTVVADLNAEIAVNVIDALGRSVIQTTIESNSQVDVSSLPNGIYYVQVGGNGIAKTFKITKQ